MLKKKPVEIKSPDLSKLIEVIIDQKTRIFIPLGADIEEAKNRYLYRAVNKRAK
jgi:hypothetical protein